MLIIVSLLALAKCFWGARHPNLLHPPSGQTASWPLESLANPVPLEPEPFSRQGGLLGASKIMLPLEPGPLFRFQASKEIPRDPQEAAKRLPRDPRSSPRGSRGRQKEPKRPPRDPRSSPRAPRGRQEAAQMPYDAPKTLPRAPKSYPRSTKSTEKSFSDQALKLINPLAKLSDKLMR